MAAKTMKIKAAHINAIRMKKDSAHRFRLFLSLQKFIIIREQRFFLFNTCKKLLVLLQTN